MIEPPDLVPFNGAWEQYVDQIYEIYIDTVINSKLAFGGIAIRAQFRPETKGKGFSFWHLISEAESNQNRNEDDRIPDLERCARIRWVEWCIRNAGTTSVSWWKNKRGRSACVVIWAEAHDFAVILEERTPRESNPYYLLKTAYCVRHNRARQFSKERDAYWANRGND